MTRYSQKQQGFVILFAVLISAVILMIGAGVFSISVKQSILSSAAREAQYAINAADMGLECVLYDDIQPSGNLNFPPQRVVCLDDIQNWTLNTPFKFKIPNPQGGESCAEVTRKIVPFTSDELLANPNLAGYYEKIEVISRGFNICNGVDPALNDPLLVERVMRADYPQPIGQ